MENEIYTEAQKAVLKEEVAKINKYLESLDPGGPGSLEIDKKTGEAVCKVIHGFVDYFSFPAEALYSLIFTALGSEERKAEKITNGYRFMAGEQVIVRLELKITDIESWFKIEKINPSL